MTRDPRLTTRAQRNKAREFRVADFDSHVAFRIGVSHHTLLRDIDARIEREKKLREALARLVNEYDCDGDSIDGSECRCIVCHGHRILAETADDE